MYNAVCFGSPWELSSSHEAHPDFVRLSQQGFFGIGPPNLAVIAKYLLDPARGFLLRSPFWLWVVPGFALWWKSGKDRADCLLSIGVILVVVPILSGYPYWYGGWCLGDRHLLPILFFAGLAPGYTLPGQLSKGLFAAAVAFAVVNHFLLTSAWPYLPPDLKWSVANASAWFLIRGWTAPNLFGEHGIASLLLPAVLTASAAWLALRRCLSMTQSCLAAAAAITAALALFLIRPEPAYGPRVWRAAIFGAYSGLDPERRELAHVGISGLSPEERKRVIEAWRLY